MVGAEGTLCTLLFLQLNTQESRNRRLETLVGWTEEAHAWTNEYPCWMKQAMRHIEEALCWTEDTPGWAQEALG